MGMMDLEDKESLPQDMNENKKCCTGCNTTETPLWRGGPAGPKSLCNACGIRYRKKRAAGMGVSQGTTTERKREKRRRKFCFVNKRRRKWKDLAQLGEVEQAAVSLLALSCDSLFSWRRGQM